MNAVVSPSFVGTDNSGILTTLSSAALPGGPTNSLPSSGSNTAAFINLLHLFLNSPGKTLTFESHPIDTHDPRDVHSERKQYEFALSTPAARIHDRRRGVLRMPTQHQSTGTVLKSGKRAPEHIADAIIQEMLVSGGPRQVVALAETNAGRLLDQGVRGESAASRLEDERCENNGEAGHSAGAPYPAGVFGNTLTVDCANKFPHPESTHRTPSVLQTHEAGSSTRDFLHAPQMSDAFMGSDTLASPSRKRVETNGNQSTGLLAFKAVLIPHVNEERGAAPAPSENRTSVLPPMKPPTTSAGAREFSEQQQEHAQSFTDVNQTFAFPVSENATSAPLTFSLSSDLSHSSQMTAVETSEPTPLHPSNQVLALRVGPSAGGPVNIHLRQRQGEIHVAVRTVDPALSTQLQKQLPELVRSLDQAGYDAKAYAGAVESGAPATHGISGTADASQSSFGNDSSFRDSGSSWSMTSHGREDHHGHHQERSYLSWAEEMEK